MRERVILAVFYFSFFAAAQPQFTDHPHERWSYFYDQRRFPRDRVPAGARTRALQQIDQIERNARAGKISGRATAAQSAWKFIGPQPVAYPNGYLNSGRVSSLAIDPRSNDTVYLGAAEGGVWKTTDGGTTWTPLTDNQPSLAIGALTIDPSNPDTIYAGTGEEDFAYDSYNGTGILKSTDGGQTWTNTVGPFDQVSISGLSVNPTDSTTILASSSIGIFRSSDAGATWNSMLSGVATSVFFDPQQPQIAWAALGGIFGATANGVYRSADKGLTWARASGSAPNSLPSGSAIGRIQVVNAPGSLNTAFAVMANPISGAGATLNGIYQTNDAGAHWNKLSGVPDFCNPQCWFDLVIEQNPENPLVLVAGGMTFNVVSVDGGATWQSVPNTRVGQPHADDHALVFSADGTRVYLGNDGGVWSAGLIQSANFTWKDLNTGLGLTEYYPNLSIHPSNPLIALAGSQDNGTHLYGGQTMWPQLVGGDGGWTAIDPSQPQTAFISLPYVSLYRTQNLSNPNDFIPVTHGIDLNDRQRFISSYIQDPVTPLRMFYGTDRLYGSTDGGGIWQAISPDVTDAPAGTPSTNQTFVISTIAVSPADPNRIYTGSVSGAVFVTPDGGNTWTDVSGTLPFRSVTKIATDPVNPLVAYATFSGYAVPGEAIQGHIFVTSDGGNTWADISATLPNIPVDDFVIDPDVPNTFYAATDAGVMISPDGGATWTTLGTGLPRVVVMSLVLHRPTRTLRAATHGRSVWDYSLGTVTSTAPVVTSLSPATMNAGSPDFPLTINGANFVSGIHVWWNGQDRQVTNVTPTSITATIPAADVQGVGRASVVVFNPSPGGGASIPAAFVVGPGPAILSGGLVSAANPLGGSVGSPGALMSLYGTNLTAATVAVQDFPNPFPLPYTLGGVTLTVGGYPAPLLSVSPGFLNFQVPYELTTRPQTVTVAQGTLSSLMSLSMAVVTPSLFSMNQQGGGQGAVRIANTPIIPAPTGTFAGSRPVQAGEYLEIYCTGLGAVSPAVEDGAPASGTQLSSTLRFPTVSIGGVNALVTFSGLTPGIAGLYVVDVQVPAGTGSGDAIPVVLTIAGVVSNTVTIAVQ